MGEITSVQLKSLLKENSDVVMVDIRENNELVNGKIEGAIHIPSSRFIFQLQKLDRSKRYVLVCKKGTRSFLTVKLMKNYGFYAMNLEGGYNAIKTNLKEIIEETL